MEIVLDVLEEQFYPQLELLKTLYNTCKIFTFISFLV